MKIVFAFSLLVIGATATLAFMTRTKLLETRNEKDRINKEIVEVHEAVEKVNADTDKVWKEWQTTKGLAKDESLQTQKLNRETAAEDDNLKAIQKEIQEMVDKRTQLEDAIKTALSGIAGVGPGISTPEELAAKVEELKGTTDALNKDLETLKGELEVAKKAAAESDELSNKLKAQQLARLKAIQLGGRSSTITAVNDEFSFVVVNIGRDNGLTMDAHLLVKRGGQLIGKLNIVNIDRGQTVADIDLKSVTPGFSILPGDQVVIENSVQ